MTSSYNLIISKVLCTKALKNKIQVIRYNITQPKYVYHLYKRFDINK